MKPNFKDGYPFPNELFAAEMRKTEIKTTNKPVYLGKTVLDLSKTLSMNFTMTTCSLSMDERQSYAIWTALYMR